MDEMKDEQKYKVKRKGGGIRVDTTMITHYHCQFINLAASSSLFSSFFSGFKQIHWISVKWIHFFAYYK